MDQTSGDAAIIHSEILPLSPFPAPAKPHSIEVRDEPSFAANYRRWPRAHGLAQGPRVRLLLITNYPEPFGLLCEVVFGGCELRLSRTRQSDSCAAFADYVQPRARRHFSFDQFSGRASTPHLLSRSVAPPPIH